MAKISISGISQILVDTDLAWSNANKPVTANALAASFDGTSYVFKVGNGVDVWNDLSPIIDTDALFTPQFKNLLTNVNTANGVVKLNPEGLIPAELFNPDGFRKPQFITNFKALNEVPTALRNTFFVVLDPNTGIYTWEEVTSITNSNAKVVYSAELIGGKDVYMILVGYSTPGEFTFNHLDLTTGVVTTLAYPDSLAINDRMHSPLISINGNLYLVGTGASSGTGKVYRYDDGEWILINDTTTPTSGNRFSLIAINDDEFYYVTTYIDNGALYKYTISTDTWTTLASNTNSKYGSAYAVDADGKLYVLGGQDSNNVRVNEAYVYDPIENEWSTISNMSRNRAFGNAFFSDGEVYVLGGNSGVSANVSVTEKYNISTGTWSDVENMDITKFHAGLIRTPSGYIYSLFGSYYFGLVLSVSDTVYRSYIGKTPIDNSDFAVYTWDYVNSEWIEFSNARSIDLNLDDNFLSKNSTLESLIDGDGFVRMRVDERAKLGIVINQSEDYFLTSYNASKWTSGISNKVLIHNNPAVDTDKYAATHAIYNDDSGILQNAYTMAYSIITSGQSAYSPDGKYLALGTTKDAVDASLGVHPLNIYSVSEDDQLSPLISTMSPKSFVIDSEAMAIMPTWSADSKSVFVQQNEDGIIKIAKYEIFEHENFISYTLVDRVSTACGIYKQGSGDNIYVLNVVGGFAPMAYSERLDTLMILGGKLNGTGWLTPMVMENGVSWFAGQVTSVMVDTPAIPPMSTPKIIDTNPGVLPPKIMWVADGGDDSTTEVITATYTLGTNTIHARAIELLQSSDGPGRYGEPVLADNGLLYAPPYQGLGGDVLVIDPVSGECGRTTFGLDFDADFNDPSSDYKWLSGAKFTDGKLYFPPTSGTKFLIIDPANDTAYFDDLGFTLANTTGIKYRDTVVVSGILRCIPTRDDEPFIDYPAGTRNYNTEVDVGGWGAAVINPDTNFTICVPTSSNHVLVINDSVNAVATGYALPEGITGTNKFFSAVYHPASGTIVAAPYNASVFLVIDADTFEMTTVTNGVLGSNARYSQIHLMSDGSLIAVPFHAGDFTRLIWNGSQWNVASGKGPALLAGIGYDGAYLAGTVNNNTIITPSMSVINRKRTVMFAKLGSTGITDVTSETLNLHTMSQIPAYDNYPQTVTAAVISDTGEFIVVGTEQKVISGEPNDIYLGNLFVFRKIFGKYHQIVVIRDGINKKGTVTDIAINSDATLIVYGMTDVNETSSGMNAYRRTGSTMTDITETVFGDRYMGISVHDVSMM